MKSYPEFKATNLLRNLTQMITHQYYQKETVIISVDIKAKYHLQIHKRALMMKMMTIILMINVKLGSIYRVMVDSWGMITL